MSLKPYKPYTNIPVSKAKSTPNGFLFRDNSNLYKVRRLGIAASALLLMLFLFYPFALINFWQKDIIFTLFSVIISLIPTLVFFALLYRFWPTLIKYRQLDSPELFLKTSPITRGLPIELAFSQKLKGNTSLTDSGSIVWRLTCAEVTATEIGTDESISHRVLWLQEFTPTRVTTGAQSLQSQIVATLPTQFPATLEAIITPRSRSNPKMRNWVEWQVQIAPIIPSFDIPESRFVLQVK